MYCDLWCHRVTWSFVASGAAVSFLDVLVGVTCAWRKSYRIKTKVLWVCMSIVERCVAAGSEAETFRNRGFSHNGDRIIIIWIKQKPLMEADIGLCGAAWLRRTEGALRPWQSTYSTCAVIVTAIVLRRWRRPALAPSSQTSTSTRTGLPCELTLRGRTIGRHIPACSNTRLAWAPGRWGLFKTAGVPRAAWWRRAQSLLVVVDAVGMLPIPLNCHFHKPQQMKHCLTSSPLGLLSPISTLSD